VNTHFIRKLATIEEMTKLFAILSVTFFLSCTGKSRSMNDTGIPLDDLIDSVENNGSVSAFNDLQTESLDYRAGAFLSSFMIMADEYNNSNASFQVYYEVANMYNAPTIESSQNGIFTLDSLNDSAKEMAVHYLSKSASLGNVEAKAHLSEYQSLGMLNE
jgi:hypothetical protein